MVIAWVYSSFVSLQWWSQHKYWNFPGHAGNFQSSRQTTASGCVETCKIYVDKDVHKPTCIAQRVTVNRIVVSLYLYILSQKHSIQFVSFFFVIFPAKNVASNYSTSVAKRRTALGISSARRKGLRNAARDPKSKYIDPNTLCCMFTAKDLALCNIRSSSNRKKSFYKFIDVQHQNILTK